MLTELKEDWVKSFGTGFIYPPGMISSAVADCHGLKASFCNFRVHVTFPPLCMSYALHEIEK